MTKDLALTPESMPAPHDLVGMLRRNLEALVTAARQERGDVLLPEDTYGVVRAVARVHEGLTDYANAFRTITKEADGYIQDELELAVGEQDGVPNSGMTVPDVDGTDLCISLNQPNEYDFDLVALFTAVTFQAVEALVEFEDDRTDRDTVIGLLMVALGKLTELGRFTPQVTKVKAFAAELARLDGGARVASAVTSTIKKRPQFKGIKVERRQPKAGRQE